MAESNGANDTDIRTKKPENIAVFTNPNHDLYIRRSEIPTPGEGECLIHVRSTGICGSDVHFWKAGHIGAMVVEDEAGLGHESAGVVIDVGPNVSRFKKGDRVTLECGVPCMKTTCFNCRNGTYNGCSNVVFFSTPPYHGTMTRYHVHPESWLHKLPDSMSFEEGALLEPLSVAFAGIDRADVRLGDPLVICGAGPIGMVSLLAAASAGANPVVITDINKDRLQLAKKLVPRVRTVQIDPNKEPKEAAEDVKAALGQEAKVVLECTGFEASVCTAIYSCRFGAAVLVIGCGKDFQTVPFMYMAGKEIDLRFQYRYHDTYPRIISLVEEGIVDLKPLVTHRYTLEEGVEAFRTASDPTAMALKVQLIDE